MDNPFLHGFYKRAEYYGFDQKVPQFLLNKYAGAFGLSALGGVKNAVAGASDAGFVSDALSGHGANAFETAVSPVHGITGSASLAEQGHNTLNHPLTQKAISHPVVGSVGRGITNAANGIANTAQGALNYTRPGQAIKPLTSAVSSLASKAMPMAKTVGGFAAKYAPPVWAADMAYNAGKNIANPAQEIGQAKDTLNNSGPIGRMWQGVTKPVQTIAAAGSEIKDLASEYFQPRAKATYRNSPALNTAFVGAASVANGGGTMAMRNRRGRAAAMQTMDTRIGEMNQQNRAGIMAGQSSAAPQPQLLAQQ